MAKGKIGRRSKKTPLHVNRLLSLLRRGHLITDAARAAGIGTDTVYRWRNEDQEFSDKVEAALLEGKMRHVENILEAGQRTWTASAWYLERRHPEEWAKRERVETNVTVSLESIILELDRRSGAGGQCLEMQPATLLPAVPANQNEGGQAGEVLPEPSPVPPPPAARAAEVKDGKGQGDHPEGPPAGNQHVHPGPVLLDDLIAAGEEGADPDA